MKHMDKMVNDSKLIKQNEKLLNLLRFYEGIDRAEMSRRLQVSMPTIYKSVDELHVNNLVVKTDSDIKLNNEYGVIVGVSIGSSLCKIVFLGFDYQLLKLDDCLEYKEEIAEKIRTILKMDALLKRCLEDKKKEYIYFHTPESFADLKNVLNCLFESLCIWVENKKMNLLSIGISCTGIINNKTQTILDAYNLNYLSNRTLDSLIFPDKQLFFEKHNIHIALVQNSNAAVIAEKIYLNQINSQYKTNENIVAIYFGVGIGAGIYIKQMYEGTNGYAGEVGHTKAPVCESEEEIMRHEDLIRQHEIDVCCTCGCNDCYDYKIRSYVFEKTTQEFCNMSADEIRTYLLNNPEKARLLGKYLGNMINTITNWLNIDLVIFTGKIYKSMESLLNDIDSVRDENPLKFNRNDCKICTSKQGSLAPAIGAAIYAFYKKYDLELSWNY